MGTAQVQKAKLPASDSHDPATAATSAGRIARFVAVGLIQAAAFAAYVLLLLNNSRRIHEPRTFGDSDDYLRMAAKPLFSAAFWAGTKPPLTALLYKMVHADPDTIFTLQLVLSIVCWGLLALAAAGAVRSYLLKPVAFIVVLAFSLSRDVFMWDPFIGSESITISVTVLFVAAALWLAAGWKRYKMVALIGAAVLVALSRDASAYLLAMAGVVLLPFLFLPKHRWELLTLAVSFLTIAAGSIALSRASGRENVNFASVTAFRIFPNSQYVDFFRKLGMPADEALVQESHLTMTPGHEKYAVLGALLADPRQAPYRRWVRQNGGQSYLKFLWFFKADTLQNMFMQDAQHVFYPDVYYYTATGYRPILKDQRLAEILYPTRLGLLLFFLANMMAALACGVALQRRLWSWIVPILLILSTYPQAFIVWNGDANEIPRHSVEHNVTERLGVWLLVFLVLDLLISAALPYAQRAWIWLRGRLAALIHRLRPPAAAAP